jgi:hypothetical protein
MENADVVKVLITPVTRVQKGAVPHLATVLTWPLASFREWAKEALVVLRDLKKTFQEPGDLEWRASALDAFRRARLSPVALRELLVSESAAVKWNEN